MDANKHWSLVERRATKADSTGKEGTVKQRHGVVSTASSHSSESLSNNSTNKAVAAVRPEAVTSPAGRIKYIRIERESIVERYYHYYIMLDNVCCV